MTIDNPKEIRLGPGKILPLIDENTGKVLIGGKRIIFDSRK